MRPTLRATLRPAGAASPNHPMFTRSKTESHRLDAKELADRLEWHHLSNIREGVFWTKDAIKKWRPYKKVICIVIKKRENRRHGSITLFRTVLKIKMWNGQVTAFQKCRNRVRVIRSS
jgi:hypothetical protein